MAVASPLGLRRPRGRPEGLRYREATARRSMEYLLVKDTVELQRGPDQRAPSARTTIVEMRTYKTRPGLRSEFLRIFRSKTVEKYDVVLVEDADGLLRW